MYLTTLIEEIRKNHEKYEGKEYYKKTYESIHYKIEDGKLYRKNAHTKYINKVFTVGIDEEVEEIRQEVTFVEAMEAYNNGKCVACEFEGVINEFWKDEKIYSIRLFSYFALKGKWYIKEEN